MERRITPHTYCTYVLLANENAEGKKVKIYNKSKSVGTDKTLNFYSTGIPTYFVYENFSFY